MFTTDLDSKRLKDVILEYMIDDKGHKYSLATIDSCSCCEMTSVYHGTDCLG